MGQRDFNVDERVHYIKNICCLNSLNWTIFHNLLHFDLFFFTKVKIITALEGFKLMAWKQDVGKIWIWWLLLIWLLIYDQIGVTSAFFFYFKKGFFFGGGVSRTDESWYPIRSLFTPCSLVSKSPEVKHKPWWMTLDVVIMNRKFSQNLSHSVIWCKFWYCPYPVTLFFHEQRMICGKRVLRSR